MVKTVMEKLSMTNQDVDIVVAGSITKVPYMQAGLNAHVVQFCPQAHLVIPDKEPVYGALKMALRLSHL
jgi:hypothetical protein